MSSTRRHRGIHRDHLIVCGDTALAFRIVEELSTRYHQDITVVLASKERGYGPRISQLPQVTVYEATELRREIFRAVYAESARAVAFAGSDETTNIEAALWVQEVNPRIRIVVRVSDMAVGPRMQKLFSDWSLLSDGAIAAPSFVAAALADKAPSHVRVAGRILYAADRKGKPAHVICGLAGTSNPDDNLQLLPVDEQKADILLAADPALDEGDFHERLRRRWNRAFYRMDTLALVLRGPLLKVVLVLLATIAIGSIALSIAAGYGLSRAAYLVLLDIAGAANPDLPLSGTAKVAQVTVTLASLALVPAVTAAVVDAMVRARVSPAQRLRYPIRGHVVVVGLGAVGLPVAAQLADLGIPVVGIDIDGGAASADLVRAAHIPIVVGDATRQGTLRDAWVHTCRAVVAATSPDVTNVKIGVQTYAIRDDIRVVIRLFDDGLAYRVHRQFDVPASRSVASIAAPAFAVAMLERQIIGTIPVHRSVVLVADVSIAPGSLLEGCPLNDAYVPGESRALAIRRRACVDFDWDPQGGYILARGDSIVVVATRKGLSRLHTRSAMRPFPSRENPAASPERSGWLDTIRRRGPLRQNKR